VFVRITSTVRSSCQYGRNVYQGPGNSYDLRIQNVYGGKATHGTSGALKQEHRKQCLADLSNPRNARTSKSSPASPPCPLSGTARRGFFRSNPVYTERKKKSISLVWAISRRNVVIGKDSPSRAGPGRYSPRWRAVVAQHSATPDFQTGGFFRSVTWRGQQQ